MNTLPPESPDPAVACVDIRVDPALCNGCTLCLQVCPQRIIGMENNVARIGPKDCMVCGHCVAICPVRAIRIEGLGLALQLATIEEDERIIQPGEYDVTWLVRLMRSRRSCRRFAQDPVPPAMLEDLVKIGTTAPSGTNCQAWTFTLLTSREAVKALGELTADYYRRLNNMAANPLTRYLSRFGFNKKLRHYYEAHYQTVRDALHDWDHNHRDRLFHGAPAAILVGGRQEASCPAEDALLATGNILLAAHAMGFGTCLIGFVVEAMRRDPRIGKALGIDRGEKIYAVIALGFPRDVFKRPAPRHAVPLRIWSPPSR